MGGRREECVVVDLRDIVDEDGECIIPQEEIDRAWLDHRVNLGSPAAVALTEAGEAWSAKAVEAILGINTSPSFLWVLGWRVRMAIWLVKEWLREKVSKFSAG